MKITQVITTAAIIIFASNAFAGTKCGHRLSGQDRFANTVASSSNTAQGTASTTQTGTR